MAGKAECCGWSSWGALAGMSGPPASAGDWSDMDRPSKRVAPVDSSRGCSETRWLSGRSARAFLATFRGRLRSRRK